MYLTNKVEFAEDAQGSWKRLPEDIQFHIVDFLKNHVSPEENDNPLHPPSISIEPKIRQLRIANFRVIYLIKTGVRVVLTVLTEQEFHQLGGS